MKIMKVMAISRPGTMPAMNRRAINSSTSAPYRTMMMLGGIRMPSVPPAAIDAEHGLAARSRADSISGMATVPTVAAVATLEPETAENIAQLAMLACSRPPGSRPRSTTTPR